MSVALKYKDITEKIIGASFEVHSILGNGLTHMLMFFNGIRDCFAIQEVIYQRALAIELEQRHLNFGSKSLTFKRFVL
jgi:hypothetical protein